MSALELALSDLREALQELGLRWYVFGAQASNVYGTPRTTADVDVTIEAPTNVGAFVASLQAHGFEIGVDNPVDFVVLSSVLPTVHMASGFPVDVVIGRSGLEGDFLQRAQLVDIVPGHEVPMITPEDLVISKVLAGRPKDLADAEAVFTTSADLDVARIRDLLEQLEEALGVSDLVRVVDSWAGQ